MPNLPISQLPVASALTGPELFVTVQSGVTKQTTLDGIFDGISGSVVQPSQTGSFNARLFAQTGSSTPVTNTITETTLIGGGLGTLSIPANVFQVGDSFHAILTGHISSVNNHNLRLRIKTNSVLLADTGNISMATTTDKHWRLEVFFTIRTLGGSGVASIVSGGGFQYIKNASTNFEGALFSTETSTGFDTTVQNTLAITAQWDTANSGDSIYSDIFTLNKTY